MYFCTLWTGAPKTPQRAKCMDAKRNFTYEICCLLMTLTFRMSFFMVPSAVFT